MPEGLSSSLFGTASWIVLASALYTYAVKKLTASSAELLVPLPIPVPASKVSIVAHARRIRKSIEAKSELEERRRQIQQSQRPFRLLDLPPELSLTILSDCVAWPSTYASLARTSSTIQRLTYEACLPRMPVRLVSSSQVQSFDLLVRSPKKGMRLASLVRHLWITPLKAEDLPLAVNLLRACRRLRSLATNAYLVQQILVTDAPTHRYCTDLTLLATNSESWPTLLGSVAGPAFFSQLKRLRLIGDRLTLPRTLYLPHLTHLSYGTTNIDSLIPNAGPIYPESYRIGEEMLADKETYPMLKTIIMTKPRAVGGLRVSRVDRNGQKSRVWLVELPADRTEIDIWSENAFGRGIWELCCDT